jgi:hypothetical protein
MNVQDAKAEWVTTLSQVVTDRVPRLGLFLWPARNAPRPPFTAKKACEMAAMSLASIAVAFAITIALGVGVAAQRHHHPADGVAIHKIEIVRRAS